MTTTAQVRLPHLGIVGHEAAKFTPEAEAVARTYIRNLIAQGPCVVVSGRCHLGGVDIWAEEASAELGVATKIFPPARKTWSEGYRPRNIAIAQASDRIVCIVVTAYPEGYTGMRFGYCYHCKTTDHIKSGGCWTVREAVKRGKVGWIHEITQEGEIRA